MVSLNNFTVPERKQILQAHFKKVGFTLMAVF